MKLVQEFSQHGWRYRAQQARAGRSFLLLAFTLLLVTGSGMANTPVPPRNAAGVAEIATAVAGRLNIQPLIRVVISEKNERGVSVEPVSGPEKSYVLSFDRAFLDSLTDDELVAAVAHEVGHVWIFSNHPYLQTERLANEVALRVVNRQTLHQVYLKLWARLGITGNVEDVLGPEPPASAAGPVVVLAPASN